MECCSPQIWQASRGNPEAETEEEREDLVLGAGEWMSPEKVGDPTAEEEVEVDEEEGVFRGFPSLKATEIKSPE